MVMRSGKAQGCSWPPWTLNDRRPDQPDDNDTAAMCKGSWLLLTLADADVAHWLLGSGSVTRAGLVGRVACQAMGDGDVNAPEMVGLPLPVGRPPEAGCPVSESEQEPAPGTHICTIAVTPLAPGHS